MRPLCLVRHNMPIEIVRHRKDFLLERAKSGVAQEQIQARMAAPVSERDLGSQ